MLKVDDEIQKRIDKEIDFLTKKIRASINIRMSELKDQILELQHSIDKQIKSLGIGPFADAIKHAYAAAVEDWYESFLISVRESIEETLKSRLSKIKEFVAELKDYLSQEYEEKISSLHSQLEEKEKIIEELKEKLASAEAPLKEVEKEAISSRESTEATD